MGSQYEAPPFGSAGDRLLGWFLEARQEGAAWLASQPTTRDWQSARALLDGPMSGGLADQSDVQYPKTKRIAREMVASLANFRHEGEFKVLWNEELYDTAHLLTQLDRHWYRTTFANAAHRAALQYAVNLGTAYIETSWDRNFHGPNKGEVIQTAISPEDVTFVQLPKDHDIQGAYVVIIRREMPINLARSEWLRVNPRFAHDLVPDRENATSSWVQKGLQKVQQFLSPALRVAGRTGDSKEASSPTVDIYTAYTLDLSWNEGLEPVKMGAYGSNWEYTVPAIGDPLPTGQVNPRTNMPWTAPATEADCQLFPLRRMTIFSNNGVAFDGSSPYWHGEVPLTRIWFNDTPWHALGGSTTADVASMETGIVALMRGIEDSAAARLDPPALIDDQMADSWGTAINPRKAGVRAKAPLQTIAEPIKYPFPPQYYDVPMWITQWIESQEARMDYITGVRDLVAMAKAKQVPGADTLEKLLEMAGPIVQDMIRSLEKPLTQLGEWRKSCYLQFYNEARIITTVGPEDGAELLASTEFISDRLKDLLKKPTFKFQPAMFGASREKIQQLISEFRYEVTESGLNEIHRMSNKLLYLQMQKLGFPISWWTLAQVAQIPNFGPPPAGTNTELERFVAQKHMETELQVELARQLQEVQAPAGGGAPSAPEGRPQSFQTAPKIESKDNGLRSTVSTS